MLVLQLALHLGGKVVPDLGGPVGTVEKEGRPVPGHIEDVDALEQVELVAGDKVGVG